MLRTACDFVIIGAGPAGAVSAARLARAGARVALIDRLHPGRIKAGEFLTPSTKAFVDANDLLPQGWQHNHLPVHAFLNGWGAAEPTHVDFIADPYGTALALDRPMFERQLIHAARGHGADIFLDSKIVLMEFERSRWLLDLSSEQRTVQLTAGKIILATGRDSRPPSAVRRQRFVLDRHAFLAASWQVSGCDLQPCLESGEDCWSYVTPAPGGAAVFYVFFDAASCASPPERSVRWLAAMLQRCGYAAAALAQVERRGCGSPIGSAVALIRR
ncbi:FAD-dependent oxidoreductase [Bradyrhizobium betae]